MTDARLGEATSRALAEQLVSDAQRLEGRAAMLRNMADNVALATEHHNLDVVLDNLKWLQESAKSGALEALDVAISARNAEQFVSRFAGR